MELTEESTASILKVFFPEYELTDPLDIRSVIRDLAVFEVQTSGALADLLTKHKNALIAEAERRAVQAAEMHQRQGMASSPSAKRCTLGAFARMALEMEFPQGWQRYRSRHSEIKASKGEYNKYTLGNGFPEKCPHKKDVLFKYRSASGAVRILESKAITWASPSNFNDPFDVQIKQNLPFSQSQLTDLLLRKLHDADSSGDEPEGDYSNPYFLPILLGWQKRRRERMGPRSLSEVIATFGEVAANVAADLFRGTENNQKIWDGLLRTIRVLCLAEDPFIPSVWAHYCDNYKGAVLGLRCPTDRPHLLWLARPIVYKDERPITATAEEWVDHLWGFRTMDLVHRIERHIFTKQKCWEYEKEWRVARVLAPNHNGAINESVSLLPLRTDDIEVVYLGSSMDDASRQKIVALVEREWPSTKVFNTRLNRDTGRIEPAPL